MAFYESVSPLKSAIVAIGDRFIVDNGVSGRIVATVENSEVLQYLLIDIDIIVELVLDEMQMFTHRNK